MPPVLPPELVPPVLPPEPVPPVPEVKALWVAKTCCSVGSVLSAVSPLCVPQLCRRRGRHDRAPGREDGLLLSRSRQDPVAPRIIAEGLVDGNDIGERDALRLGRCNRRRNDAVIRAARKLRLDRVGIDPGL